MHPWRQKVDLVLAFCFRVADQFVDLFMMVAYAAVVIYVYGFAVNTGLPDYCCQGIFWTLISLGVYKAFPTFWHQAWRRARRVVKAFNEEFDLVGDE